MPFFVLLPFNELRNLKNKKIIKLEIMKTYLILLLFSISIILNACSNDDNTAEIVQLRVNHFKQTAMGVGPKLVLQTQEAQEIGTDKWNYFYSNIKGFNYEPGFIYLLSVEKQQISDPPQDDSAIKYILRKVISKEKVETEATFKITLKSKNLGSSFLTGDLESNYKILNEIEVHCNDLCKNLSEKLQTSNEVSGIFNHAENNSLRLIDIISE